jgi:hypothetical protein
MKNSKQDTQQTKKSYTKPVIREVPLRPEEAVLGVCKTSTGAIQPANPSGCVSPSPCYSLVS